MNARKRLLQDIKRESIKKLLNVGVSQSKISKQLDLSYSFVSMVVAQIEGE